jgi:hypothetical protein
MTPSRFWGSSPPGYDQYLRATSVPEGQELTALSADEQATIHAQFRETITFKAE